MLHISILIARWAKKHITLLIAVLCILSFYGSPQSAKADTLPTWSFSALAVPCTFNGQSYDSVMGSTDRHQPAPIYYFYQSANVTLYDSVGAGYPSSVWHYHNVTSTTNSNAIHVFFSDGVETATSTGYAAFSMTGTDDYPFQNDLVWNGAGAPTAWTLGVVSPVLNSGNASVQPSPQFNIKLAYTIPSDVAFSNVRFYAFQCPDVDHCTWNTLYGQTGFQYLIGSQTLQAIRDITGPSEFGYIYEQVPVVQAQSTLLYFVLATEDTHTLEIPAFARLIGDSTSSVTPNAAIFGSSVDIPNPLTNPFGFVSALFLNLKNWVVSLVVPSPGFMDSQLSTLQATAQTHFPIFFQLSSVIQGSTTQSDTITLGSLNFGSTSSAPITFFNPTQWNPDSFSGFRNLLSMMMWVWLMYFIVHKVPKIFSS